jgi:protein-tyrosine phosphatase
VGGIGWLELQGVVNMRDVGGLPTADGLTVRSGRLLRSDNLQDLSPADIAHLVDVLGVTDIVDLRSHVEVSAEGPGPLRRVETVVHHHHTLFREEEPVSAEDALAVPWRDRREDDLDEHYWTAHYLGYLADRPDSAVAALRVVAHSRGATIVHCAAGKDRTGTVVGLALAAVGVPREHVVADYVATGERIEKVVARLIERPAYRSTLVGRATADHMPRPETMERLFDALEHRHGGVHGWLAAHGWQDRDTEALRARLLS